MTAPESVGIAVFLREQLAWASPDLLREMVKSFAVALMSAEADTLSQVSGMAAHPTRRWRRATLLIDTRDVQPPATLPSEITVEPGTFAGRVVAVRHPRILRGVAAAIDEASMSRRALSNLGESIARDIVPELPNTAHDAGYWHDVGGRFWGGPWTGTPFLWAESYFYRLLLEAVGYFNGPAAGVDPFRPSKAASLAGCSTDGLADAGGNAWLRFAHRIQISLWANNGDLGAQLDWSPETVNGRRTTVLVDESLRLWRMLAKSLSTVVIILDNAGPELVADLALADHLIHTSRALQIVLHHKPYPYYVSDATLADVLDAVDFLATVDVPRFQRLQEAFKTGRLRSWTHPFYGRPEGFAEAPPEVVAELANADLIVAKGDLNYRRIVGDRKWPYGTKLSSVAGYFASPLALVRTIKSDVVVGVNQGPRSTTGEFGLIQLMEGYPAHKVNE
jgi:Damage-control phosphatase ARMT1-like domain